VPASRRAVLTSSLAGVAGIGLLAGRSSDAATSPTAPALTPLPATHDPVVHAVRRLSFGATPALVAHVRKIGVSAWLDEQLGATTADVNGTLGSLGTSTLPLPQPVSMAVDTYAGRNAVRDLQLATFSRSAWGDLQVHEVLVELFSNHLSINVGVVGSLKLADDRDVVQKNVLGSFTAMLKASSTSPAMLRYLNNNDSYGSHPNENYARELLELHTVGVHGGYVQKDVHNAALALTGLTFDTSTGLFSYNAGGHCVGPVRVMGWSHPNADAAKGQQVATSLVTYLASHPSTAKQIATKLVRRFVSDDPPAGLVASTARAYLAAGTEILPTLRHVLTSPEFARSAGQKTQRPYDWCAAAVRRLGLHPADDLSVNGGSIVSLLEVLGQTPFAWSQPDGYPDTTGPWASTASVLARWNVAQALVHGQVSGLKPFDAAALLGTPVPTTAGGLVTRLCEQMLLAPPRKGLHDGLLQGISSAPGRSLTRDQAYALAPSVAALILSSPEAQVR
jgi:uncharacterized protein (DUF1800 family)